MEEGLLDLKAIRLRLLITGLPPVETTISDTIRLAQNRFIIWFCLALGLTVGAFYAASLHMSGSIWALPLVVFTLAPVVVNFLANFVAAFYLKLRLWLRFDERSEDIPGVRTALTVFFSIAPLWAGYLTIQSWLEPGKPVNLVFYLAIPVLYVVVSEAIHVVIFRYVIHDLEKVERGPSLPPDTDKIPSGDHTPPSPKSRPDRTQSRVIKIGKQTFTVSEIIMLEAQGNYLKVVTSSGDFIERCLMSTATEYLDESLGLQIHRSCWVSFAAVSGLVRVNNNFCVKLVNGDEYKIARPRQRQVRDILAVNNIL